MSRAAPGNIPTLENARGRVQGFGYGRLTVRGRDTDQRIKTDLPPEEPQLESVGRQTRRSKGLGRMSRVMG